MIDQPTALDHAARAWDAAYAIDELRGDAAASEWLALRIHDLIRPTAPTVCKLADALERRLAAQGSNSNEGAA